MEPKSADTPPLPGGASAHLSETEHSHHTTAAPATSTAGALARLRETAEIDEIKAVLLQLSASLDGADELDRLTVREHALQALKDKGLSRSAALVDAALGKRSQPAADTTQGQALAFKDPEPWPEPVDGAELLDAIDRQAGRYLMLPPHGGTVLALWTVLSHCFDCFDVLPLLAIVSPDKACGKTRTLDLLSTLVARPVAAANISPAAVFRTVERHQPTLLIDEGDTFLKGNEELRGILNSGHTRTSAFVLRVGRTAGDDHETRQFRTWCPKAIALIGRLPDTLESRSVAIRMKRLAPGEKVEPLRHHRRGHLEELRRKAARWAKDHQDALRDAEPEEPEGLNGRHADNWWPPLAIADQAGGDWPARARAAALASMAKDPNEEGSHRELLLADIRDTFDARQADRIASTDLCDDLRAIETSPWDDWSYGRGLKPHSLAKLLRDYGIRPRMRRDGGVNLRGYQRADFEDTWYRYLSREQPQQPQQPQQVNDDRIFRGSGNRNTPGPVAVGASAKPPASTGFVAGVAVGDGESGEDAPAATGTWGEV